MGLSFVAVDFETANSFRGSPCAVGLVRVEDGVVVGRETFLMRPPVGYDDFDGFNTEIHGITKAMVKGEPRFRDRLADILAFSGGLPLVAHNAAFDLGVLRDACSASGVPAPDVRYACSLVLSRQTYDLISSSLPYVADHLGIELAHHDAGSDAGAAAAITVDIAGRRGCDDLDALVSDARCSMGWMNADGWSGCRKPGNVLPDINPDADPAHPFYGQVMVFTGTLWSMTRQQAWDRIAQVGAIPGENVSRKTNILVTGWQDQGRLSPGTFLSGKASKARELREKGQSIEVITERDFVELLDL